MIVFYLDPWTQSIAPGPFKLISSYRVGLCIGGGVGAEVMDVHPVNYFCFRPPVMNVKLDPVCHVVGYAALLQSDISTR